VPPRCAVLQDRERGHALGRLANPHRMHEGLRVARLLVAVDEGGLTGAAGLAPAGRAAGAGAGTERAAGAGTLGWQGREGGGVWVSMGDRRVLVGEAAWLVIWARGPLMLHRQALQLLGGADPGRPARCCAQRPAPGPACSQGWRPQARGAGGGTRHQCLTARLDHNEASASMQAHALS
jgi:hypothetical protein